jgi:hypothetical protein
MEIFPPHGLPGVGMGSTLSIVGMGGLVALATTSGAMLAQGLIGTLTWIVAAVSVLVAKDVAWGDRPEFSIGVLVLLALLAIVRIAMNRRSPSAAGEDALTSATEPGRGWLLPLLCAAIGGGVLGFAWSEWNEAPFTLGDTESIVGLVVGLACALVGAWAAYLFLTGSIRAGGDATIVGAFVVLASLALNALGFYVPFIGYTAIVVAAVFVVRLRRSGKDKYKGLRILS